MMKSTKFLSLSIAAAAIAFAAPASATTFAWTSGTDFDVQTQAITPEFANQISFSGEESSYNTGLFGAMAHSHGQPMNWSIILTINNIDTTVFTQFFPGDAQTALNSLGIISFAGGNVSAVGFSCDSCSGYTYHQFGGSAITLGSGAVPEPASWALLISGFGLIGAAARRRRTLTSASVAA
ncbi:MAG: PEP-CTERM sorting domain-containing protein [Sandarakinorhabdus sp.]|nr:PEP-CTERM sorting domain-containing protein [Sandarakinorhabdus sp.]